MRKEYEDFVFHVNAHQMEISAEMNFNNQVDRMTFGVYQSDYPPTSVIAQWAHERRDHGCRDGGYAWAQQHGPPLTKAECPICQQ